MINVLTIPRVSVINIFWNKSEISRQSKSVLVNTIEKVFVREKLK